MSEPFRNPLAALALAALAPASSAQIPAPELPPEIADVEWAQKLGAQVPLDTRFVRADDADAGGGREVALSELVDGRPVVFAFVYYECPMLCDLVLEGMVRSLRAIELDVGDRFDVVVVGIDPGETVEMAQAVRETALETYGREGTEDGWHFLLGDEESIAAVTDAVGFSYTYVPETDEYSHAAGIGVLTPKGELARLFYGTEFAPRDLQFGLIEASEGTIGTPVQKVILRCFQYDPLRGEYGLAIMGTIRIVGVATFAILVFSILRMVRRDRTAVSAERTPSEAPTA